MSSYLATSKGILPSTGSGNIITTAAMIVDNGGVNILVCPFEGSRQMQNRMFKLVVSGHAVSGTTSTLTVGALFTQGRPVATVASNGTAFMATSATSLASTNQNFFLEATLMYDSTSKTITGYYMGSIANTLIVLTAVTATSLVSVDPVSENQFFSLSVLFGTTSATNNCIIDEFEISPM